MSVSDKSGLVKLAKSLKKLGMDIVSTGGTAEELKKGKINVIGVSSLTKYPQMLGGRVKSLHPIIHAGILADRDKEDHVADLNRFKVRPIDIVVCNLYPFEKVISKPEFTHEEAIEHIDVGGPTMLRAAAKNYKHVAIVVDPNDYDLIVDELKRQGTISLDTKLRLALKAFRHTKEYDALISRYLTSKVEVGEAFPSEMDIAMRKVQSLRYGENPHQRAAFYKEKGVKGEIGITEAKQLHGKELSFNNIADLDAAWNIVNYFADPTVAIIKHMNPCGVGTAKNISEAYKKAYEGDPVSAYGGIIASNREVDAKMAGEISSLFVEAIIAPGFDAKALQILKKKQNLRLLEMPKEALRRPCKGFDIKRVGGGFLIQDPDIQQLGISDIKIVSNNQPTLGEMEDLFFAWGGVKHVKSNAIVVAKSGKLLGVGAGQMSRIDSTKIALEKAGKETKDAVLASDAFFPFRDVVDLAAKSGISAIIQPGGSIHDQESIDAANEHGIALLFTGRRHFKH
ncbi:MAG: bifunctional phosphoribosylaminoimidazolecarboxamide formyltransferase/IMP cyclohydrolase [Candidatus Saganbacteria bacterium]|nr:bifunctional phosphoribosylaminoimidazolecarboxamide formyltransferase/IMP cyclohydrolase [Candidatus Saganbacteria bacterium]